MTEPDEKLDAKLRDAYNTLTEAIPLTSSKLERDAVMTARRAVNSARGKAGLERIFSTLPSGED